MITRNLPVQVLLLAVSATGLAAAPRIEKTINRDWTFQYFPAAELTAGPAAPAYDDAKWPAVALPHTWSTYETTRDMHPFIRSASERDDSYWWYGWGWYRKRLVIGRQFASRLVAVEFDGVQKYARIYLNGELVGEHKGGYTSFSVDLTPHFRFGQENVLAVQVSNRRDDPYGQIPPMTAGNFNVYGGIYRDVRLVIRDRLHVPFQGSAEYEGGTFVTTPEVSAERGALKVRTWVRNDYSAPRSCTLVTTVRDAAGKVVAQSRSRETIEAGRVKEFAQEPGPVVNPRLWSPDSPYLYRVFTEVRDGARLADLYESPLGFRWFEWNRAERRLYLNGKKVLLRGINRHQEYPWLGDAMPKWMHHRDLEDIRYGMGLNFQRTAHYPQDPYVYDLCDRLGFILIEEAPNIKDIAFGRDVQRQNLKEMIRRDRNHPSVFIWSIGNETNQPADSAWAREEDPSRLIYLRRGENGGDFVQMTDKDLSIENLLRCTVRGWYANDDRDFGPETRNPKSGQVTGTEAWQHETCARSERLAGDNVVVWLYADHGADREYLNSPLKHINPKGWVDAYRFPKYVYHLWQANFTAKPMAFIQPHYWREQYVGQRKDIVVDSNCDEVILKIDGEIVGARKPTDENSHSVVFENVAIRRGTLSAEGRKGAGRGSHVLPMAGNPARLVLKASPERVAADRSGISVVSVDIVDAAGAHVYGANPPLTWSVSGAGTLVGPALYSSDAEKNGAMEGAMYIDAPVANVVRAKAAPGVIRVRVSAPGLAPAEIEIAAVAPAKDAVEGVVEPPLSDNGRLAVRRDPAVKPVVFAAKSSKLAEIRQDYDFKPAGGYREQLAAFVRERNPGIDPFTAAYRVFIERMTRLVEERGGHLVADDYNFNVRAFNEKTGPYKGSLTKDPREETRARIKSTLFVPERLPELKAEGYGRFEPAPGVVAERVSYATGYGLRVPAIVYRPARAPAAKLPGFIVVNGHGGDKYSWYASYTGILYAQAGAVVLTYDPIGEGERNAQRKSGTRQHDRKVDPPEMARHMAGLMITDIMQAVSYLSQRPEVDAKRIAAAGYSMGSFILSLGCAVEPRLNACVLVGGGNLDGPGGYWDSSGKSMCQSIPYQSLTFLGDRGAAIYDLHAAHAATLIFNGDADDVVAIPRMGRPFFEDLHKRTMTLGGKQVFEFDFEPGGGHRPYFITRPVALWLERRLDFPNWTPESIAAMPVTHIGLWAQAQNVPMDKLYATELREGGTRALGSGIPAVARDALNALHPERWEREKDKYVYESWLREAGAKVGR